MVGLGRLCEVACSGLVIGWTGRSLLSMNVAVGRLGKGGTGTSNCPKNCCGWKRGKKTGGTKGGAVVVVVVVGRVRSHEGRGRVTKITRLGLVGTVVVVETVVVVGNSVLSVVVM